MRFDTSKLSKAAKAYLTEELEVWAAIREAGGFPSDEDELNRLCGRWLDFGKAQLLQGKPIEAVKTSLLEMADHADVRGKQGTAGHYHPGERDLNIAMINQVIAHLSAVTLRVVSHAEASEQEEQARLAEKKEAEKFSILRRALGG